MALVTFENKNRNAAKDSHESELRDDDVNELKAGILTLENFLVGTGLTVIVDNKTDFPAPVAGVITLVPNTIYRIVGTVNTGTDRINTNGADILGSVSSPNTTRSIITYTGAASMITVDAKSFTTGGIVYNCTSGNFLDFNGTGTEVLKLTQCNVYSNNLGDILDAGGGLISECILSAVTTGFTISGSNNGRIDFARIWSDVVSGTFLDLGAAVISILNIGNVSSAHGNGEIFLDGLASGANFSLSLMIHNCVFSLSGTGKVLNNITENDTNVTITGNSGAQNTRHSCLVYVADGDEITTTIGGGSGDLNNPIALEGTFTVHIARRFTADVSGEITYHNGVEDEGFHVQARLNGAPSTGGSTAYACYIAINGVIDLSSRDEKTASSGSPQKFVMTTQIEIGDTDTVQIFVENLDNTANFISDSVNLNIN